MARHSSWAARWRSFWAPAAAAICGVVLVAGCQQPPPSISAFEGKVSDWTQEFLEDSPELATRLGVDGAPAALDDRSAIAQEIRRTAAVRRLAELRALPRESLTPAQQLTHDILAERFDEDAAVAAFAYGRFDPTGQASPYVLNPLDSAFLTLPDFFERAVPLTQPAEIGGYVTRLAQVADAIDAETARARAEAEHGVRPPGFIIDATIAALERSAQTPVESRAYVSTLSAGLEAMTQGAETDEAREALSVRGESALVEARRIVRDEIAPAELRAAAMLRALRQDARADPSVAALPDGEAYYAALLRLLTSSSLSPNEIHNIGLRRVEDLQAELDIALRRIGMTEGPVGERLRTLTNDPFYRYEDSDAGRAQLLEDVRARIAQVEQLAPRWFGRLPRAPLEVRPVPFAAQLSAPGAYYSEPTPGTNAPGVYYINLRALDEMTKIDLPTQDYHEAVPGHHFQIALSQELETPLIRRMMSFNSYAEGWGLYAETLAEEQNLYDENPVGRIGYLRWQLWRAARLVVDTGLHAQGWSRERANAYLSEVTGDAPGIIATEVDRYVVWPGQACGYELGRRTIMQLRERARTRLGPAFDLRNFHYSVLLSGEMPLPVLEAHVNAWLEQSANRE